MTSYNKVIIGFQEKLSFTSLISIGDSGLDYTKIGREVVECNNLMILNYKCYIL